jgi:hypothetical protein
MDSGMILSVTAIAVSVLALCVSAALGLRQVKLAHRANHIPAIIDLLTELRTTKFHDDYYYVVTKLRSDHDPALGISGLPELARSAVLSTAYYYQAFGFLIGLGVLDEVRILPIIGVRLIGTWEAIEPYVTVERNRVSSFLVGLEILARHMRQMPNCYPGKSFRQNWHRELLQTWHPLR